MLRKILTYFPLFLLILTGIYFILSTSPSVRYWVDDFCSAAFLKNNGFWGAQIGWWKSWTGRYSAVFFTDLFESIGPWVVNLLPILLFGLLIISSRKIFFKNTVFAFVFYLLVLLNAPNIIQSFYWQTGALNYIAPFIFLNLFFSLFLLKRKKFIYPLAFLLMFIGGGFSESFALASMVFLVFVFGGIILINPERKKEYVLICLAGIFGVAVSLLFMYLSPGNSARALTVTKPKSLSFVVGSTIWATKWYLLRFLTIKTFLSSLALLFTSMFLLSKRVKIEGRGGIFLMILSLASIIPVTAAVMGSGYYSMSTVPPERTLFIIVYFVLLALCVFFFAAISLLEASMDKKYFSKLFYLAIILNLVFSCLVTASMQKNWSKVKQEIITYSQNWDGEVKRLPEINNIPAVGGLDNFTDNKGWVASCIASYYGFPEVKIITPVIKP